MLPANRAAAHVKVLEQRRLPVAALHVRILRPHASGSEFQNATCSGADGSQELRFQQEGFPQAISIERQRQQLPSLVALRRPNFGMLPAPTRVHQVTTMGGCVRRM